MKRRNKQDDPELLNFIDRLQTEKKKTFTFNSDGTTKGSKGSVPDNPEIDSQDEKRANLIRCPDCGREISISADACPHCGRPRDKTATEKIGAAATKMQKVGCLLTLLVTIPILIILLVLFL